ncbi:MAG: acetyl-coenzyme A synthetase N-terminal domain-containing protein, partial [Methanomicrobiales archaeon]|nr:acetyl-coenzyme A synthetase N-terminal domain-containing protein [Methanomicrobiales archaeon]
MADEFEVKLVEQETVIVPDRSYRENAWVKNYEETYQKFIQDPEGFWDDIAQELDWFAPYERVKDWQYPH